MTLPVLHVAVVGHTNTGKTSLMRTLLRQTEFGEVSDRPATTRHVEGARILVKGQPLIELYDTPGMEDSIALLDHLESQRDPKVRGPDGVDRVQSFLAGAEAHGRFSQEAKALRQVLASEMVLYVIDARDRVLGKHRDELAILAQCARPVVPVLNFVASPEAQTALWRDHLARANLHAVAEFDTVVLDEASERRLLEKMRTLLDRHQTTLNELIEERAQQRRQLIKTSASLVADLLIDVGAHAVQVPADGAGQPAEAVEALKQRVRDREQQCVEAILSLHEFRTADFRGNDLPLADGRWGVDLFSPAVMKQFGVRTGGAAAAGAMVGLTIDAMVGGLSLGAATALGAAIGALVGTGHTHGRRIVDRIRGYSELRCDDSTINVLAARQISLIRALLRRGHASLAPIEVKDDAGNDAALTTVPKTVIAELDEARIRPGWSRLNAPPDHNAIASPARQGAVTRLTLAIEQNLHAGKSASS